ncbi:protein mistic [Bacillus salacetis]|uniref:protein mistic n=1 Tax=Bacillus salacetis TaxID=2315464 RepID=UPI0014445809|nr:protein mistic [Bacillus salacetis]
MKIDDQERNQLSQAIDQLSEGLDAFIELYNESVEDKPLLQLTEENEGLLGKAIIKFGGNEVNEKVNKVIAELLEWLPLDDVQSNIGDEGEEAKSEKTEN